MDLIKTILAAGFKRAIVLDGADAGITDKRIVFAIASYLPDSKPDNCSEAVIHPYYPVAHRAFKSATTIEHYFSLQGIRVNVRTDIPLKPILNRLTNVYRGINTLAYMNEYGSRFHIQCFSTDIDLQITHKISGYDTLSYNSPNNICFNCRKCIDACPTHAISLNGFNRDNCLRNWMLSGKIIPDKIANQMGNRLIGCDVCEHVCPMNKLIMPVYQPGLRISLEYLLKSQFDLNDMIGYNLAIHNRILSQSCIIANNCNRSDLLPELEVLSHHNSMIVRYYAERAYRRLSGRQQRQP